ncbi:MAG: DUF4351 domain-containing protein, partial [Cyanobacteriota bacterium SKYGB_h_bin112]|nr:DUF4351 domain-containing protein [Cyanobacteriota bacterium SKYGB_h_bin112]
QWLHNLATQIDCLTQQITTQLGDLPPDLRLTLQQLSLAQLAALPVALPSLSQMADLEAWLTAQTSSTDAP